MSEVYEKVTSHIKPEWLKIRIQGNEQFAETARIVRKHALHTICSSGMCPNKAECWSRRTATFMILGDVCTRSCRFCATATGKALPPDKGEPQRVADSIRLMGLKHAVVTSVTRDDLPDGGADHWAQMVRCVRETNPDTTIELLIPDMNADERSLRTIIDSSPDIIGHNIETVRRLTPRVRSRADYDRSLRVVRFIAGSGAVAKSGIMVGLGETDTEVEETLSDLYRAGCRIVTIGQYLRPTARHIPVDRYISPETFGFYKSIAEKIGFEYVASAPLVRSSYLAEEALASVKTPER